MELLPVCFVLQLSEGLLLSFVDFNLSFVCAYFYKAIPVFKYFVFSVEDHVL